MKRLFIEGENDSGLRRAFSELLKKELPGKMPKIVLGNGISQTVSKFRTAPIEEGEERFLLVDSDEQITDRADLIRRVNLKCSQKNCKLDATEDNTFFMVQEVEAWILSQPQALGKRDITKGLPVPDIEGIHKPSEKLSDIYKANGKTYHKVIEFPRVFGLLDSALLKSYSAEFKALVEKLAE